MPFGHALILQSSQHPTVSGFYKLLACCMTVCRQLDYFKVCVRGSDATHSLACFTKLHVSNMGDFLAVFAWFKMSSYMYVYRIGDVFALVSRVERHVTGGRQQQQHGVDGDADDATVERTRPR